ncbi:choice-of-anchor L domain-containing protein, partial [Sphingobacterium tabacisoli]
MKTIIQSFLHKCVITHLVLLSVISAAFGQATVTPGTPTATQIATALNTNGITISSPQIVRGGSNQIAIFSNGIAGAGLGVDAGVLFSTGHARNELQSRNSTRQKSVEVQSSTYSDPELTGITSNAIYDAVIYTFKIKLTGGADALRIAYQFGSEEYPDYVGSRYNDTFGFFVRGPGLSGWVNMARLPNTAQTVTAINKVNYGKYGINGSNSNGYVSTNSDSYLRNGHTTNTVSGNSAQLQENTNPDPAPIYVEYNGLTKLIQYDLSGLTQGGEYEFKIAIADAGDQKLDAGVFVAKIEGVFGADLAIEKIVDKPTPCIDDIVEFTLTAKNIGPAPATGVVVNDLLPNGFEYDSHTAPAGTTYVPASGVWTIGGLALYGESVLKIRAKVKSTGNYTNQATITGTKNDPDATNNTATVTLVPTIPTITGVLVLCQENTTQLSGSGTAAASNAWTSSNTTVATVSSTGLVTGLSAGTTTITYKNSNGCTATALVTVTAKNTVTAGTPRSVCINTALTAIEHTTTGATGIGTATGLPTGVTATFANNKITISGTPSVVGVFTYNIPLTGGCGNVAATGTITVKPTTTITVQPVAPAAYCIGGTSTLDVTATGDGTLTYEWFKVSGSTATSVGTTKTYSLPTSLTAGTHTYRVVVTGGCGAATSTDVTVTVKPATTITVQPVAPAAYCIGGTSTLDVTATGDGTLTYEWFKVSGSTATSVGTTKTYSLPTSLTAGTHTYRVVVTGGCGAVTSTDVTVTVKPATVITVQPVAPAAYCIGGTSTLDVTATGDGTL